MGHPGSEMLSDLFRVTQQDIQQVPPLSKAYQVELTPPFSLLCYELSSKAQSFMVTFDYLHFPLSP